MRDYLAKQFIKKKTNATSLELPSGLASRSSSRVDKFHFGLPVGLNSITSESGYPLSSH